MQEKYFINCYKGDKNAGSGRTWQELLQWCHEQINKVDDRWSWNYGKFLIPAYLPQKIHNFFTGWRHNPNDGGYWTEGHYDRIFVGWDENHKKIEVNGNWHNPEWKIKEGGTFVSDSYGRVIPSGYIKACYLNFNPKPIVKINYRVWRWCNSFYDHDRDFRKGPVPGRGGYRKHCGWKYSGDHGGFGNEARQDAVFATELKDIQEEYGAQIKYNKGRASEVWIMYTDWDGHYRNSKGKGWKRTRVKKQWMRGLRKLKPLS